MDKLKSVEVLQEQLAKLPGIGKKSAEKMAYALLLYPEEDLNDIGEAIKTIRDKIHYCPICGMITDIDGCYICDDSRRDQSTLMVVSFPKDVMSLEKSDAYHGLYHVLNGELNLSKGINVEDLNLDSLLKRLDEGKITEVILATNPTLDGETTSLFLSKLLAKQNVEITRLAYGLQMGGNLDYVDPLTLSKALEGRRKL